jgi:hypothetical protein
MLNTASYSADPASPAILWRHLDAANRMALVIERFRFGIDGTCTEDNFHAEPETCDLSLDELRGNIGRAQQIVAEGTPEPTYSREQLIAQGVTALAPLLPAVTDLRDRLALHNFTAPQIEALWPLIARRLAQRFDEACAPRPDHIDMGDYARDQLSKNAN